MGRFLAQQGQVIVAKIYDKHVTRNNLSKIRDLALQVFEPKTCNAKIAQRSSANPRYTASTLSTALKIVVAK